MKQTFASNTLMTFLKGIKPKTITKGSIDVDHMKIHQVKQPAQHVRAIDLEPISLDKNISRENQNKQLQIKMRKEADRLPKIKENRFYQKNNTLHIQQLERPTPEKQFYLRVQKFINYFVNINQTKKRVKVSTQQFYNLIQARRNLESYLTRSTSIAKYLFQIQYTNNISFLKYVIQTKQQRYEIYQEYQEIQKILNLLEQQINEVMQIYLNEQMEKILILFPPELIQEIQNLEIKFAELYGQEKREVQILEETQQRLQTHINSQIQPFDDIVQEGQMDIKSFQNSSFQFQQKNKPQREVQIQISHTQSVVYKQTSNIILQESEVIYKQQQSLILQESEIIYKQQQNIILQESEVKENAHEVQFNAQNEKFIQNIGNIQNIQKSKQHFQILKQMKLEQYLKDQEGQFFDQFEKKFEIDKPQ